MTDQPKKKGGFASMSAAEQRAIARMGGVAAHAQGRAHEFSKEEARVASLRELRAAEDAEAAEAVSRVRAVAGDYEAGLRARRVFASTPGVGSLYAGYE